MKSKVLCVAVGLLAFGCAMGHGRKANRYNVNKSCVQDAATAGCGDAAGGELVSCLNAYWKANKGFEVSSDCRAAMDEPQGEVGGK